MGIVLFCLGLPNQALAHSNAVIAAARRLYDPASFAQTLSIGNRLLLLVGDNAAVDEWAGQLVAVATEQGFSALRGEGTAYLGFATVKKGNVAAGLSLLRSGMTAYHATGVEAQMPHNIALLVEACGIAGETDEARILLDDALQKVETTGEQWFTAELNRQKGELLRRQGYSKAAEGFYGKALSIAKKQEAKLWELRAAVSLARLRRDQGRRVEARDFLAPVYGWFTEGFAMPDLKEAKALLDELT